MMQFAQKYYQLLIRSSSSLQSPFLLAVRLYWGWQFMQTGWGKLSDIGNVIGFFTDLGIPAPALNAYFVSALEFGGGVLLILGLGSRLIALPLVIDMMVAYIAADREALFSIFSNPDKFTVSLHFSDRLSNRAHFRPWYIFGGCSFGKANGSHPSPAKCRRCVARGRSELSF
jgi:putative oxidoreductase